LYADALGQRRQKLEGYLHLTGSHVEPGQVDADLGIPGLDGAGARVSRAMAWARVWGVRKC
jgi:hypothetical protein